MFIADNPARKTSVTICGGVVRSRMRTVGGVNMLGPYLLTGAKSIGARENRPAPMIFRICILLSLICQYFANFQNGAS
ncbi:hypothetical protein [Tropicimonas aquimaris]|uniref:Uncharacterized protein n=1 Tax=Tropicimonas aquimaris TaxID=914152 RepID=A0ABW3IQD2_9RHOB